MTGALHWLTARALRFREETDAVKTITFDVPDWAGHLAGQHVDIRLTAPDGYVAQRSYSLASPAGPDPAVDITVERVEGGEVSPFLLEELRLGDTIELRGPIGGFFTWSPTNNSPLMLIAGGSGIVPLMSMLRTRDLAAARAPACLVYSTRSDRHIIYRDELAQMQIRGNGFTLIHTLTRNAPPSWTGARGRVGGALLAQPGMAAADQPTIFICGPTPFVEATAEILVALGHQGSNIRTERFGPSGESK